MARKELVSDISPRVRSNRLNGRLGGLATARTHGEQFKEQRSSKAGSACRDKYGVGYYTFIHLKKLISPKNKVTGNTNQVIRQVAPSLASAVKHKEKLIPSHELMKAFVNQV